MEHPIVHIERTTANDERPEGSLSKLHDHLFRKIRLVGSLGKGESTRGLLGLKNCSSYTLINIPDTVNILVLVLLMRILLDTGWVLLSKRSARQGLIALEIVTKVLANTLSSYYKILIRYRMEGSANNSNLNIALIEEVTEKVHVLY